MLLLHSFLITPFVKWSFILSPPVVKLEQILALYIPGFVGDFKPEILENPFRQARQKFSLSPLILYRAMD